MPAIADDVDAHPIIFNEWSINRILAGEKTQTRRIVKPQPPDNADKMEVGQKSPRGYPGGEYGYHDSNGNAVYGMPCPYGQPGDALWVREAFRLPEHIDGVYTPKEYVSGISKLAYPHVRYEADGEWDNGLAAQSKEPDWGRLRPSIHMPRELCRIRLRVEDVRVERVQEVSPADAQAEGLSGDIPFPDAAFKGIWNSIHGNGAWDENPWVWVIEFSRINE